jgi:hypothetical protein
MKYNLFQYANPSMTRRRDTQLVFEIADCKNRCCVILRNAFVVRGIVTRERMAMAGTRGQRAEKGVEEHLKRHVRFEVFPPRWHGLGSLAHGGCDGARICRDERANLGGEVWLLVVVSPTGLTMRT